MMKKTTWLIMALLMVWMGARAQNSITIDSVTLEGRATSSGWIFEGEQDTILAFTRENYSQVMQRVAELQEEVRHLEETIQARDELIDAFENYESNADRHIAVQKQMIGKADSLYTGYRDLYNDLEDICDPQDVSLVVGSGLYRYGNNNWRPLLNLGVEYRQFQGSYLFGKDFNGLSFQYRIFSF